MKPIFTLPLSVLALIAALQAASAEALTTDQLNEISSVEARIRLAVAQGRDTSMLVQELRLLHQQYGEDFGAFVGNGDPSDREIVEAALGRGNDGGGQGRDDGPGPNTGLGGGDGNSGLSSDDAASDNTGFENTGSGNTGFDDAGSDNTGFENEGAGNTGFENEGSGNTGLQNDGSSNTGFENSGSTNTGL
jgi:PPE-repeat protein